MAKKHSHVGASSAKRWFNCAGSVRLCQNLPRKKDTAYSEEGTAAHELAEKCLLEGRMPEEFDGTAIYREVVVDDEMIEGVNFYVSLVRDYYSKTSSEAELLVEEPFDLTYLHPDLFGTNDACILEPFGDMHVFDLKYGAGIGVSAYENEQLKYYALGAAKRVNWLFNKVFLHIVQPRTENQHSIFEMSIQDLLEFEQKLLEKVKETEKADATLKAGEWCRFCPAAENLVCPELNRYSKEVAQKKIEALTRANENKTVALPTPAALTDEEIVEILKRSEILNIWLKEVHSYALDQAIHGRKFEGYKLVQKEKHRRWVNEQEAESLLVKHLEQDAYKRELLSIAQAEKILGKRLGKNQAEQVLKGYWEKPLGEYALVKEDNKKTGIEKQTAKQLAARFFNKTE